MKIKKSTVEELVNSYKTVTKAHWMSHALELGRYRAAVATVCTEINAKDCAVADLLSTAEKFSKLNFETVAALFEALGVEVLDD